MPKIGHALKIHSNARIQTSSGAINAFTNEECQGFSQSVGWLVLRSTSPPDTLSVSAVFVRSFSFPFPCPVFAFYSSLAVFFLGPVARKKALLKSFYQDKSFCMLARGNAKCTTTLSWMCACCGWSGYVRHVACATHCDGHHQAGVS